MDIKAGLRYSKDHEWVELKGRKAYVGITDYAQHALGSIVFIELPKKGRSLATGDVLAVVESVKAASDTYTPVSGIVTEVNDALAASPETINNDPYGSWIAAVETADLSEHEKLMDEADYRTYCEKET